MCHDTHGKTCPKFIRISETVAYIIEDRGFRVVCLENRTITVFNLLERQNVVFAARAVRAFFLEFVCTAFPRIVFALAFWETYRGKGVSTRRGIS